MQNSWGYLATGGYNGHVFPVVIGETGSLYTSVSALSAPVLSPCVAASIALSTSLSKPLPSPRHVSCASQLCALLHSLSLAQLCSYCELVMQSISPRPDFHSVLSMHGGASRSA